MGMAANLVQGPLGRLLALTGWTIIFSLLLGAINAWYLQSVDAGVVNNERFDRVVLKDTTDKTGDDGWAGASKGTLGETGDAAPNVVYTVQLSGTSACKINSVDRTIAAVAGTFYTPQGTEVTVPLQSSLTADTTISGCTWSGHDADGIFGGGLGGLVKLLLQAAGVAPPIALMYELGSFGTSFLKNFSGTNPLVAAVLTAILLLLVANLLNVFFPFVTSAFKAVDGARFVMMESGLGRISVVIKSFWGVVLVGSMMSIAWEAVKGMRGGGNLMGGGKAAAGRM